jgi:LPXTG-motif cell wall-anchored protein
VRRVAGVAAVALANVLLTAWAASAQSGNYPPSPTGGGAVGGGGAPGAPGVGQGGALPVTGANITVGMVILVALVLAGVLALLVSRRRAAVRK